MNSSAGTGKWLIASVAINLIFIGALMGDWVSHSRRSPPPMHWATGELDASSRSAVKTILDQQKPVARALRQDMRAIDKALMQVIRAPNIEKNELERVLSAREAKQAEYQVLLQSSLKSILPVLTPPQREAVLRRMLIANNPRHPAYPKRAGDTHKPIGPGDRPGPPPQASHQHQLF